MRSIIGPEIRFWYLLTRVDEKEHSLVVLP